MAPPIPDSQSRNKSEPRGPLPDWYPAWARELADLYYSGTTSMFVLWGNVHDLVRRSKGAGIVMWLLRIFSPPSVRPLGFGDRVRFGRARCGRWPAAIPIAIARWP